MANIALRDMATGEVTRFLLTEDGRVNVTAVLEALAAIAVRMTAGDGSYFALESQPDGWSRNVFTPGDVLDVKLVQPQPQPQPQMHRAPIKKVPVPSSEVALVERAFFGPYVGNKRPLEVFLAQLDKFSEQWDGTVYHSPYVSLVQSSGWGKSKAIYQLGVDMNVFVVYCSFLPAESLGFPKRTPHVVASIFTDGFTTQNGIAYLIAAARVVSSSQMSPAAWMLKQLEQGPQVGKQIVQEYIGALELLSGMSDSECGAELDKELSSVTAYRKGLKLLYAFDEARLMPGWPETFLLLRRALRVISEKSGVFALFCGTSSKVINYSPPCKKDKSGKVARGGLKLFPRLRLVSAPDEFLHKRKRGRGSDVPLAFLFGRPMWGAFVNQGMGTEELIKLAMSKMLGGVEVGVAEMTDALAAAMFGVSVASTVVCTGSIVEDMVAGHMSTLVWISEDRELLRLCQTSEPVMGEAVSRLFMKYGYFESALKCLIKLCNDGLVLEGVRGKLVARILVMLAMYRAAEATGSKLYATSVRVIDFFEALLGKEATDMLEPLGNGLASSTFKRGRLCFNHFLPMTRDTHGTDREAAPSVRKTTYTYMPQDKLEYFYQRAAAFMFAEGEWAAEFGLPIFVESDASAASDTSAFSFCDVQVKNVKESLPPKEMTKVRGKLSAHGGADALKLVMCFAPGQGRVQVHADEDEVTVTGSVEMYPCAAGYAHLLQQIVKARLEVRLETLLSGDELEVAKEYTPWLYRTDVIKQ